MLFVGTPLYENKVCTPYLHGLMQTMSLLQSRGLPMQYAMEQGTFSAINREQLVKRFLKTDCQFFLSLDADMAFTAHDVLSLIAADVDIVSGLYRYRQPVPEGQPNHCFVDPAGRPIEVTPEGPSELQDCKFLPGGMLLIRRPVFEKLYRRNSHVFNQGFHLQEQEGGTEWQKTASGFEGEDTYFSRICREAGFKLFVKADVKVGHIGEFHYRP